MKVGAAGLGPPPLLFVRQTPESLNEGKRRQLAVKSWGQIAEPRPVILAPRRIGVIQITPALMGSLGLGGNGDELGGANNIDPAVASILEPQYFLPGDDAVLDDPVERAADQFSHALRPHSGRHPNDPAAHPACNAVLQRLDACATDRDLGEMKGHHVQIGVMPVRSKA